MTPGPIHVAQGVVLDGRYRIEDVVGQGGMATVYRARDEVLGRDVAVKLFPPTPDSDEVLRHQAEIKVLSQMDHPGLVSLHDAGSAYAGGPLQQTYIVMELVPGPTLADLLATGALSRTHAARIGRQLAEAIAAVHAADVVHRDIKPANILLVERAAAVQEIPDAALTTGPIVKLADFGIARFADGARLTMTGTTLGTATYLSPEQATGSEVGPATDVYALGLVLLECLTGRKAFTGTVAEVAAARLTVSPPIPEELGPEWTDLVRAMTAREAGDRITMVAAALRLTALSGDGPDGAPTAAVLLDPARRPASPAPDTAAARTGVISGQEIPAVDRTQPLATTRPGSLPSSVRPRRRPAAGAPGTRPGRRTIAVAAVAAALLAALVLPTLTSPSAPSPPDYPAVEGPLGEVLQELQRSVEP